MPCYDSTTFLTFVNDFDYTTLDADPASNYNATRCTSRLLFGLAVKCIKEFVRMCYFITAYVPKDFCTERFENACRQFGFLHGGVCVSHPELAQKGLSGFRLTNGHCDCDWGGKQQGKYQGKDRLAACLDFLEALGQLKNAKSITLLKHDYKGELKLEKSCSLFREKRHLKDIDKQFLAGIAPDVLYEIGLYPLRGEQWL